MGIIKDIDNIVDSDDLDITTPGKAVVKRIIAGTNVSLSSTGVDSGTGNVTINASGGGGGVTYVINKTSDATLTGLVNGSNTVFNLSATPIANSLRLNLNGVTIDETDDYTLAGSTITLSSAPFSGDRLSAYYSI